MSMEGVAHWDFQGEHCHILVKMTTLHNPEALCSVLFTKG